MVRSGEAAIAWGKRQINDPVEDFERECLRFVRMCFDVQVVVADAGKSWDMSSTKHAVKFGREVPRAVAVHFELASVADHVATSLGEGLCLSNDILRRGRIDIASIDDIARKWGATRIGWTEDVNGVRVYQPGAAPAPVPPVVTPPSLPPGWARPDFADLSHWNTVTKPRLKAALTTGGLLGLWHKATQGTGYVDPRYAIVRAWMRELAAEGLTRRFGGYVFTEPKKSGGKAQAQHFLRTANVQPGDLPPMIDTESAYVGGLSRAFLTDWHGDAVETFKAELGVEPEIYLSQGIHLDKSFACKLWVPRYNDSMLAPKVNEPWSQYWAWQFSNGVLGKPDTIAGLGHVDLNTIRGNRAAAEASIATLQVLGAAIPPVTDPKPTPPVQEDDMPLSDADLTKIRAIVKDEVAKRTGDVVKVPANEAVTYGTNEELYLSSAMTRTLQLVRDVADKLGVTTPGK